MRRIYDIVWVAVCMLCGLTAQLAASPIDSTQAMRNASAFAQSHRPKRLQAKGIHGERLQLVKTGSAVKTGHPLYYVFNRCEDAGYVIAAGDDCISPILAYSESGGFDAEDMPENLLWWLSEYERQMEYAISHGMSITAAESTSTTTVEPLLHTTWNQGSPYNFMCPTDNNGTRCLTGCVATAIAQIMYYHKWPDRGKGEHSYTCNVNDDDSQQTTLAANFGETAYRWGDMATSYSQNEAQTPSALAVATLMAHVGIGVESKYGSDGTSAFTEKVASALKHYFRYDAEHLYLSTDANYQDIMIQELQNQRPIFFSGNNGVKKGEGDVYAHAFVCDGYDGGGYFHFNWGWGGKYDGYFLLTSLKPYAPRDYSFNQEIVYGIKPFKGDIPEGTLTLDVHEAGGLGSLIEGSAARLATSLKVTGPLNGSDILELRKLAGRDQYNNLTSGILTELDLSEARIVDGGGCYFQIDDETYYKSQYGTKTDVFPDQSFMSTKLRSIKLPNSIKSVGRYAFVFCYDLTSVDFGSSVESLDFSCFNYTSLPELIVPEQIKSIGPYAFCNMSSLKRVDLNSGLTQIGYRAFEKDINLEHINSKISSPFNISEDVFSPECYATALLHVASGKTALYRQRGGWNKFIEIAEPAELIMAAEPTIGENLTARIKNVSDRTFCGQVRIDYPAVNRGQGSAIEPFSAEYSSVIPGGQEVSIVFPYIPAESDDFIISYRNATSDDWITLYRTTNSEEKPDDEIVDGVVPDHAADGDGIWIYTSDGLLVRHIGKGKAGTSKTEAVKALPRGFYIIREGRRARKYMSRAER